MKRFAPVGRLCPALGYDTVDQPNCPAPLPESSAKATGGIQAAVDLELIDLPRLCQGNCHS